MLQNDIHNRKYINIAELIIKRLMKGDYPPNMPLPSERELARSEHVAVGTVHSAYEMLRNLQIITAKQGSGWFFSEAVTDRSPESLLSLLWSQLASLDLVSPADILAAVRTRLDALENAGECISVAWVDCTPDVLKPIAAQLSQLPNVRVQSYLLDDFFENANSILPSLDFVITSPRHFNDVAACAAPYPCKPCYIDFAVGKQSTMDLLEVSRSCRIAVLYQIDRYYSFITKTLQGFDIFLASIFPCDCASAAVTIPTFDPGTTALLLPSDYPVDIDSRLVDTIEHFAQAGGTLVYFCPEIDEGSLLYLQSQFQKHQNGSVR